MKKAIVATVLSIGSYCAWSQEAKKPPVLPADLVVQFFKTQAQEAAAQNVLNTAVQKLPEFADLQEKQKASSTVINELLQKCGSDFTLQLIKNGKPDKDGDPTCVVKPSEPKPESKPAEPAKK